jgi:hypothetical protein
MTTKKARPARRSATKHAVTDKELVKYHECWLAMQRMLAKVRDEKPQTAIRSLDRAARSFARRSRSQVLRARVVHDVLNLTSTLPSLPRKQALDIAHELLRYTSTHQSCVTDIYLRIMEARAKLLQHGDSTHAAIARESLVEFVRNARSQVEAVEKWLTVDLKRRTRRVPKAGTRETRKRERH